MGVDLEWGLIGPPPQTGQAFSSGMQAGRQTRLQRSQDNALATLAQNPDDPGAQNALIAVNPEVGLQYQKATMERAGMQRAMQARALIPQAVAARFGGGMPQNGPQTAPVAPQGVPGAPTPQGQAGGPPAPSAASLDPSHPATQAIGAAATSGQDYMSIIGQIAAADPEGAKQTIALVASLDEQRRGLLSERSEAMGQAAQYLKGVPQEQRQAALAHIYPTMLAPHGITAEQIGSADLSDNGLNGYIGSALGTKAAIDVAQSQQKLTETATHDRATEGLTASSQAEAARHNAAEERVAGFKTVQPGENIVDVTGGGSTGVGAGSSGGGHVALDGNNPGGIVDGAFARSQPGYKGANGRYAGFATLQDGINAQTALLQSYIARGIDTPAKIAARWAPAGDGSNNPTSYAANVARQMGIGVNDKITPANVQAFQRAQATQENSMYGQRVAQGGGPQVVYQGQPLLDDSALQQVAAAYKISKVMPPVYRDKVTLGKILNAAAGMTLEQAHQIADGQVQTWQNTHTAQQVLNHFEAGAESKIVRSQNVAVQHLDLYRQAAQALQNGNVPMFNSISQMIQRATGKPAPTNAAALHDLVMDEVTKGVLGTAGGVGDREKASRIAAQAGSPAQIAGAVDQLESLMVGQVNGLKRTYEQGTGRHDFERFLDPHTVQALQKHGYAVSGGGGDANIPTMTPEQARAAPSGTLFRTTDGRTIRKH